MRQYNLQEKNVKCRKTDYPRHTKCFLCNTIIQLHVKRKKTDVKRYETKVIGRENSGVELNIISLNRKVGLNCLLEKMCYPIVLSFR